jgi:6-pyruvoyltetrahydropterin/6-carboxytetrahydropterin synthase
MAAVRLTRRVGFSSGHRYWIPALDEAENRARFGRWASPYNHGHNYALEVTVEGAVDPATGMVVNIKTVDDVLQDTVVAEFDGRSINDEIPAFHDRAPTVENLLAYLWERLESPGTLPGEVRLVRLRLEETPELYGEMEVRNGMKTITLTRQYEFAASHRLHVPGLTPEQNVEMFGKCNNPAGHGHNYVLEVTVEGEPDPKTGMMAPLEEIDARVNELVVDRYDHRNLNEDLPEFRGRVTTTETVVQEIFDRLDGQLPAKLRRVRLLETARSIFEVAAPE